MARSPAATPSLIDHPKLGAIRSVTSFAPHVREFLESMIVKGEVRCIWHEGYRFVPLRDVEPYSVTALDEGEAAELILPSADHSSGRTLIAAIDAQISSDEIIRAKKAKIIDFVESLNDRSILHPFTRAHWITFWSDVADVGANLAGEIEARKISEVMTFLEESAASGTIGTIGLPHFHRILLSLAAPELDRQFDAVWSPGRGRLEIKDPDTQPIVVALLHRLAATFNGYRGDPEGSETPSHRMNQYLDLMSLKSAT